MVRLAPHTVVLHGHELSFVDSGSGPVVLFIHGILGSQRQWSHLVDEVDDDHRVVVPDLFGHGDSAKPTGDYSLSSHAATLRDLLDHLGIDRVTLVGHSLGGGSRCSSTTSSPSGWTASCSSRAAASGGRSTSSCARRPARCRAGAGRHHLRARPRQGGGVGPGRAEGRLEAGGRHRRDLARVHLARDQESRRAFLATTRAVIDIGGQSISAHDHLQDVAPVPTLVVWGSRTG